jgi:hypothetical protein
VVYPLVGYAVGSVFCPSEKIDLRSDRYRALRHMSGGEYQLDILARYAKHQGTIPLVCFYNASPIESEQSRWHCGRAFTHKQLGCTLAPLEVVQHFARPWTTRSFAALHEDERVIPWRCIACPRMPVMFQDPYLQPFFSQDITAAAYPGVTFLDQLPEFLNEGRDNRDGAITLPSDLYPAHLGCSPRWIVVMDTETNAAPEEIAPGECQERERQEF